MKISAIVKLAIGTLACAALVIVLAPLQAKAAPAFPGTVSDYNGFTCHDFTIDGCNAKLVEPKQPAPGHPWIWRAMFWDAYNGVDLAMLNRGFYLAYIDVGDTFGSPQSMTHWEPFYDELTKTYGLSKYPALEGLSRGGMFIYHWATLHPDKVSCIFGDSPLCDLKIWPRHSIQDPGADQMWSSVTNAYGFASLDDALAYDGNPTDDATLLPIAKAHVPIIHIVGDADVVVVPIENSYVVRAKYLKLGGPFFEIIKHGCDHHPHSMANPTMIADFIAAHSGKPSATITPDERSGEVVTLQPNQWQ